MKDYITVIGGGLAGSEAAYQIAKRGIKVKLYEMKPVKYSPAHSNFNLAEIVCSNSLKSNLHTNACGLLKEELRLLNSLLIRIADETKVPAGQALAVDREKFSQRVTQELEKMQNIEIIRKEVGTQNTNIENLNLENNENLNKNSEKQNLISNEEFNYKNEKIISEENIIDFNEIIQDGIVIIATGPLTSNSLSKAITKLTGQNKLYFYDAAAPIIEKDSINMDIAFWGDRYEQERKKEETIEDWKKRISSIPQEGYINLPMNKEEYEAFYQELINAEIVTLHDFEKKEIFEGCMPIEIMAKRGIDTLRFGPLKPVGFTDKRTGKRPYAVIQLRQDNNSGNLFNMVGFQTNLKFGEQQRVFQMIPGLENASFVKYGVMHRNTYINSTQLLNNTYQMKNNPNIYFAGQITGVEGYVESISSGLVTALNAVKQFNELKLNNITLVSEQTNTVNKQNIQKLNLINNPIEQLKSKIVFPETTVIGSLAKYISTENKEFQPMNANFGILPELPEKIKDKKLRYTKLADRSIEDLKQILQNNNNYIKI